MVRFADRVHAGRVLAEHLAHLRGADVVVLGLPRGGVPVAAEVAASIGAPLDVIVVRKLGVPWRREVAMGAIGEGGVRVLDARVLSHARVSDDELAKVERGERALLDEQVARLRSGRERIDVTGRTVVIVDDGIATGSTARAAGEVARRHGAARVVLAVPVAPADMIGNVPGFDEVVSVLAPVDFVAVGNHYDDFSPTTDDEVAALLDESPSAVELNQEARVGPAAGQVEPGDAAVR